jgi:ABC-2 type transport system ATP-binding protein
MRQRLGVARAMVDGPKVIFLDEPTLGLDPACQRQMLKTIRDVAENRGSSVILSTHFLDKVEQSCSRALIMNRGLVVVEGTIDEIKRKAAAPVSGHVQVPPEMHGPALTALREAPDVAQVLPSEHHTGAFTVTLSKESPNGQNGHSGMNAALASLLKAEVPVSSFELEA